jgi:four helix bundle protein
MLFPAIHHHQKEKPMKLRSYKDLEVWQFAMDLAVVCYRATSDFPKHELFIPANIAEGQGRGHTKEFLHFLGVARGSLMELETHLLLSCRVELLTEAQLEPLLDLTDRISRMLSGLRKALKNRSDS